MAGALGMILGLGGGSLMAAAGEKHRREQALEDQSRQAMNQMFLNHLEQHPELAANDTFEKSARKAFGSQAWDTMKPQFQVMAAEKSRQLQASIAALSALPGGQQFAAGLRGQLAALQGGTPGAWPLGVVPGTQARGSSSGLGAVIPAAQPAPTSGAGVGAAQPAQLSELSTDQLRQLQGAISGMDALDDKTKQATIKQIDSAIHEAEQRTTEINLEKRQDRLFSQQEKMQSQRASEQERMQSEREAAIEARSERAQAGIAGRFAAAQAAEESRFERGQAGMEGRFEAGLAEREREFSVSHPQLYDEISQMKDPKSRANFVQWVDHHPEAALDPKKAVGEYYKDETTFQKGQQDINASLQMIDKVQKFMDDNNLRGDTPIDFATGLYRAGAQRLGAPLPPTQRRLANLVSQLESTSTRSYVAGTRFGQQYLNRVTSHLPKTTGTYDSIRQSLGDLKDFLGTLSAARTPVEFENSMSASAPTEAPAEAAPPPGFH